MRMNGTTTKLRPRRDRPISTVRRRGRAGSILRLPVRSAALVWTIARDQPLSAQRCLRSLRHSVQRAFPLAPRERPVERTPRSYGEHLRERYCVRGVGVGGTG